MTVNEIVAVIGSLIGAVTGIGALVRGFLLQAEAKKQKEEEDREREKRNDIQRRQLEEEITIKVLARAQNQIDELQRQLDIALKDHAATKQENQKRTDELQKKFDLAIAEIGNLRAQVSELKGLNAQWGTDWEKAMSVIRQLQNYIVVLIAQIKDLHGIPAPMPEIPEMTEITRLQLKKNSSWDLGEARTA